MICSYKYAGSPLKSVLIFKINITKANKFVNSMVFDISGTVQVGRTATFATLFGLYHWGRFKGNEIASCL